MPVRREYIDTSELAREVQPLVRTGIASGVELRFKTTPAPIIADARQIQQLMMNLIVNAAEAIRGARAIAVMTGIEEARVNATNRVEPGMHACLRVRETGAAWMRLR